MTQHTTIEITGPYDLREVALMGFGHRDEKSFDGTMRMAFCLDGGYQRSVGVAARQDGDRLALEVVTDDGPLSESELETLRRQVARVVSLDHDGAAFSRLCQADPALAAVHARAPGFRPALFYSPYEAAVWSIVSARRPRGQGIGLRTRLAEQGGAAFDLAGVRTPAVPTPSRLLQVESVPGLPADRMPRLHAIAEAAQNGKLEAERLRALPPEEARTASCSDCPASARSTARWCWSGPAATPTFRRRRRRTPGRRSRRRTGSTTSCARRRCWRSPSAGSRTGPG